MRYLVVHMILQNPPSKPPCFDDVDQWEEWLVAAHESGIQVVRRSDTGKTRGQRQTHFEVLPLDRIDICCDCTPLRSARMARDGRCVPTAAAVPPPQVFRFRPRPGTAQPAAESEAPAPNGVNE